MNENVPPRRRSPFDPYISDKPETRTGGAAQSMKLFDIAYIRAVLWRQRFIIAGVTVLCGLIGLVATLLMTPMYNAFATVRVDNATVVLDGQDVSDPYVNANRIFEYMSTLSAVLKSRAMAEKVAASLQSDGANSTEEREISADSLQGGLSVTVPPDSRIMTIEFMSSDPNFAARAANAYAKNFVLDDIEQATNANAYAREFLSKQIMDTRLKLNAAEKQAIGYARQNRIIGQPIGSPADGMPGGAGTAATIGASGLMDFNSAFNAARARRIEAQGKWRAVAGTPASQLPEVQRDASVQALRSQLAQKESQLADLRERYRDDYPEVREAASEISVLRQQLASLQAEIKNSIRNEYQVAQRQEAGLQSELARVSDATLDEQDRRVQYDFINREVEGLRDQLGSLMQRFNEISAASNLRSSRVTLLDSARIPKAPSSPNLLKNLFIATVLGAGLALTFALLREIFDNRLRSIEDLENGIGLPALGQTPFIDDDVRGEINDNFTPISEAYSSIRASLDFVLLSPSQKVVQFTSAESGEGKSTSVAAIARKYALIGRKVLLIDMDLRRPSLHKTFVTKRPENGIVDVLHSRASLQDALLDIDIPNLDVVPVSQIPSNPVEILSSGLVAEFLERNRKNYDIILIDSSPVLGIADAPLLSRFVDAVIFVIEANRTNIRQSRAAVRRLQDVEANVIGAIVTKYRALEAGQSYDYQYRYYTYAEERD